MLSGQQALCQLDHLPCPIMEGAELAAASPGSLYHLAAEAVLTSAC